MFLNQKGQESAPFELLIAVILMSFVVLVGLNSLTTLESLQCQGEVNAKLEELKEGLEIVSQGKGQFNFVFFLPECGVDTSVRLIEQSDPAICTAFCSGSKQVCTLLSYRGKNVDPIVKCINISPLTEFGSQFVGGPGSSKCPVREGTQLEDWDEESIVEGAYLLVSPFIVETEAIPVLCAYRSVIN